MFDILKRFRKTRQHVVTVGEFNKLPAGLAATSRLRRRSNGIVPDAPPKRGMWVRDTAAHKTGILTNLKEGSIATVMFVDDIKGENILEVDCPEYELRQAVYEEIPLLRRPSEQVARKLGYGYSK